MESVSTPDLLCLHLRSIDGPEQTPAPYECSTPGIVEALNVGPTRFASQFELLSVLSALQADGLIDERATTVVGLEGERTAYRLTSEGHTRASEVAASVSDRTVTVRDGDGERTATVDAIADMTGRSLAGVLAALDEGVVVLEDDIETPEDPSSAPFVDREDERSWLDSRWAETVDGEMTVAVVAGEPGVGKTSLIDQFADRVEQEGGRVARGTCRPEAGVPYRPLFDAFAPSDPIGATLREYLDPDSDDVEFREPEDLAARRRTLFSTLAEQICAVARTEPLLLVLDDIHWIDPSTAALVAAVLERVDEAPVMVVLAGRPEGISDGNPLLDTLDEEGCVDLTLAPFDRSVTEQLLARLVGTRRIPPSFVDAVQERTGGNPLFVAESVTYMLESGTVQPRAEIYPTASDEVPIPETVEGSIVARLEALDEETTALLNLASLLGETFDGTILRAASHLDDPVVRDRVDLLIDGGLWTRSGDGQLAFVSSVVRDAVRDQIPEDKRVDIHRRIAAAYREAVDDVDRSQGSVSRHLERAGDLEEALEATRSWAAHATDVYAHEVAVDAYERALDLARRLDDDGAILGILEELGDTHALLGEFDDAIRSFQYVRERTADVEVIQRTYRRQAWVDWQRGAIDDGLAAVEDGLVYAGAPGSSDRERCRLYQHRGHLLGQQGDATGALGAFEHALEIAQQLGEDAEIAGAYHGIGTSYIRLGRLDDAVEPLEDAIDLWEDIGDDLERGWSLISLGAVHFQQNELETAVEAFQQCYELFEELGFPRGEVSALNNLGAAYFQWGRPQQAEPYCRKALELAQDLGDTTDIVHLSVNLGMIALDQGDLDAALEHADRTENGASDLGSPNLRAAGIRMRAEATYFGGNPEESVSMARRALDLVTEADAIKEHSTVRYVLGRSLLARGDSAGAIDQFESGLALAGGHGFAEEALQNRAGLVQAYLAADDQDSAAEHADELASTTGRAPAQTLALGQYLRVTKEYDRAEAVLTAGIDHVREQEMTTWHCLLELERARLELDRGNTGNGTALAEQVRDIAADAGIDLALEWADQLLGDPVHSSS